MPIEQTDSKDRQVDLIMLHLVYLVNVNFFILDCFIRALELLATIIIISGVLYKPQ